MSRPSFHHGARLRIAGLCLVALLGTSTAARADDGGDWSGLALAVGLVVGGSVVIDVGGLVVGAGQAAYVAKRQQAPLGWRVAGGIFAGLNLGAGAFFLATSGGEGLGLGLGIAHLAIGAFDLTFTLWSSKKPEGPRLALAPTVLVDTEGRPAPAASLQLARW
jgi:hypothetical protein